MANFWIDIDNPPQAQYLSPIAGALRARGHSVSITARNHEPTLTVLANRGESAIPVGGAFGESAIAKIRGTVVRAIHLHRLVTRTFGRPSAAISTSRSGVMASRTMKIPSFTLLDYEGVELGVFRRSGTTLLHPMVVPASAFVRRGFPAERLISFPGLKEDLSFSGLNTKDDEGDLPFPRIDSRPVVLVRPPSETSHYSVNESVRVLGLVIDRLAESDNLQVVFAPREPKQSQMLEMREWKVPPVVLDQPIPLVKLLLGVDWVVTGGGTMLREAAWFGVPGVTVFQGEMPAVDLWLESKGAIRRVTSINDLDEIRWNQGNQGDVIVRHPEAIDRVVDIVLQGAATGR